MTVVIPGYRVARTLARTVEHLPREGVDRVLYGDDGSDDGSAELARSLGLDVVAHARNRGYGAVQKTLYREALQGGADVVVMVHGDFQYRPELVPAMAAMVSPGGYDVVLGSRTLNHGALRGGMPRWKFMVNRALTAVENGLLGAGLSEYHTGYRAYSRRALSELPLAENRDDFVFDNQLLAQALHWALPIGEVSCPAHYFDGMSTITFLPGVRYGLGCLGTAAGLVLHRAGARPSALFDRAGRTLDHWTPELRPVD